jgi:hypothetical protein
MKFLKRLIEMAAPGRAPVIEALTDDSIEATKTAADTTAASDAVQAGRQEKERIRLILESDEARGRMPQAVVLATTTDLSPEVIKGILAASGREDTRAPKDAGKPAAENADFFAQHRAANPELWAARQPTSAADTISRMQAAYAHASGQPITKSE